MTSGKAKKSGTPKKAPKVSILPKSKPMFMKESDSKINRTSAQQPMKQKHLSK